jgi:hypothetical protein
MTPTRPALRFPGPLLFLLSLVLTACGSGGASLATSGPPDSADTDTLSPPSVPPIDTTAPPVDTTAPPPPGDTVPQPPDSVPTGPPIVPVHHGIPSGPFHLPAALYGPDFNGAYHAPWLGPLLADLETARRTNTRVLLNLTGSSTNFTDENGFSMTRWKQLVDRFRGLDLSSYISDGTIVGHFLLDEPNDPTNFKGEVSTADIEEMARYSKEIWPTMATLIRAWPAKLKGYPFKNLDAAWAQYHSRFGPIQPFIESNVRDAKAAGLALVMGLNVMNGGSPSSGIPGLRDGKFAMSASELRTWGKAMLDEPYVCAFLLWKYHEAYFSRADIKAAMIDLTHEAEGHPEKACRHS